MNKISDHAENIIESEDQIEYEIPFLPDGVVTNPNTVAETEELKLEGTFKFKQKHDWVQRGPYLVCLGCDLEHGEAIGINQLLVGFDQENNPIIKAKEEVFKDI